MIFLTALRVYLEPWVLEVAGEESLAFVKLRCLLRLHLRGVSVLDS